MVSLPKANAILSSMTHFSIGDVVAHIDHTHLTPSMHWEDRHELYLTVKRSRAIWKSMSQDQKDAAVDKVKGSLAVMVDTVEDWIPDAFRGDSYGEAIKIELVFAMADVYSAVELKRESSSMRLKEANADIQSLVQAIEEEED